MKKETKGLVIGTAAGILAGAIAGILLAPKSGKETRADIAKYLHEIKDKVADELQKAGEVTKEKYNGIVSSVVDIYEAEKKISTKDAKDIKDKLDKNFDQVKKIIKK